MKKKYKRALLLKHIGMGCVSLIIVISFFSLSGFVYPIYRTIEFSKAAVTQGTTLLVAVTGVRPGSSMSCWFEEKEIPMYAASPHMLTAHVPISVLEKECVAKLSFSYHNLWSTKKHIFYDIPITAGTFTQEKLSFSKNTKTLIKNPEVPQERKKMTHSYITETSQKHWAGTFIWPVKGRISSSFGAQRIYKYDNTVASYHKGVDIAVPKGKDIHAANRGVVLVAEYFVLSGHTIIIDHGQGVLSIYKHLSRVLVQPGDIVEKNTRIGLSGSTGISTGPHLHWEIRVHSIPVDPVEWTEELF